MRRDSIATLVAACTVAAASLATTPLGGAGVASAVPAARHSPCGPVARPEPTEFADLLGELFPSGFSYGPGGRYDFVENEYELPTPFCQAGLPTTATPTETTPLVVPVAVTVICATATVCPATRSQIDAQMNQVNNDFAGTDISFTTSTTFRVDPTLVSDPGLLPYSPDEALLKRTYHQGDYGTANVYITSFSPMVTAETQGLFAWSTMPVVNPTPTEQAIDGIVLNSAYVGGGFKVLARQLGYWLGLYDEWHNGLHAPGDYADDTPAEAGPIYDCMIPQYLQSTPLALQPAILNNIMSWTPDTCMQRFSPDQAVRAHAVYAVLR